MQLQQSGIINTPLRLNWDIIAPIDQASLKVGNVEIGNQAGASAEAGWGCEQYATIGKFDASLDSSFLQPDPLFPITFDLVDAGDGIVILTPFPCDTLTMNVTTDSATAIVIAQYDGSAFTTVTGGAIREDVSATGVRNNVFPGIVKAGRIPIAGLENIPGGWYALKISGGDDAVISSIRAGYVCDRVGIVADGNSLSKQYNPDTMTLLRNYSVFSYITDADSENFASLAFGAS